MAAEQEVALPALEHDPNRAIEIEEDDSDSEKEDGGAKKKRGGGKAPKKAKLDKVCTASPWRSRPKVLPLLFVSQRDRNNAAHARILPRQTFKIQVIAASGRKPGKFKIEDADESIEFDSHVPITSHHLFDENTVRGQAQHALEKANLPVFADDHTGAKMSATLTSIKLHQRACTSI